MVYAALVEERRKIVVLKRRLLHGLENLIASNLYMRDCKHRIKSWVSSLNLCVVRIHKVLNDLKRAVLEFVSLAG